MTGNIDHLLATTRKERDSYAIFWIGFVLYMISYTISMSQQVNYVFCQVLQATGLLMMIATAFALVQFRIQNKYLQLVFVLYCIWLTTIILRGVRLDYVSIKLMLFDAWFGLLPYFVPLLLLFPKKIYFYKTLFVTIVALGCFYILYDFIFIRDLLNPDGSNLRSQTIVEYFSRTLAVPCLFLLLTYKYHSKKIIYIALFVVGLLILFALFRARRSLAATTLMCVVFAYLLYFRSSSHKVSVFLVSLIAVGFLLSFGYLYITVNSEGLFSLILERGLEDTRTGVEDCFYNAMSFKDWIIGKGINGEYYCPSFDKGELTGYRPVIETDYLQFILKGGLVSLGLFLLIAIPAMLQGLFNSNNLLSRACGVWIFYALLNMYPASINTFTMQYVLVWVAIAICYSKDLRNVSDYVLVAYFQNPLAYVKGKPYLADLHLVKKNNEQPL